LKVQSVDAVQKSDGKLFYTAYPEFGGFQVPGPKTAYLPVVTVVL